MKVNRFLIFFLLLLFPFLAESRETEAPRKTRNFNREWKYSPGDVFRAASPDFNDSEWETVGIPHSFSTPYFMSKDFYVGYGWYRKRLTLTKKEAAKKIFLEFDGVFQEAEIFVNGNAVGTHVGGYTGFSIDISKAVHSGENQIAIRVNNLWKADVAPRAGEHVFSGGIYRNVRLVVKDAAHIAWCGAFVTTPGLAAKAGAESDVKIATEVCNTSDRNSVYRLQTDIIDARNQTVATVTSSLPVAAGQAVVFDQTTAAIPQPGLWHPDHPVLYKAVSRLYEGARLKDTETTTFGFRWFEWTADRGFFLNGAHYYFKGANVHQDHAGWGDAVTEAGARRDVQMVKDAGFNFIRGSHYPHSPAFSQACDETGMLFWAENAFWGLGGFNKTDGYWNSSAYPVDEKARPGFHASLRQQLTEMIRIHRNHPSVITWSMSNEPFFTAPETVPPMRELLKELVELSRRLDPTRPAAIGGAQRPLGTMRIDRIGDLAGYNGDGSSIADFQSPGVPSIIAEYGSATADRPGLYEPGWGDLAKDHAPDEKPWRSGQAIWCAFDHGSIAGSSLGKMGIIDYFRLPKRSWYWYRNAYLGIAPPEWPAPGIPAKLRLSASKTEGIGTDGLEDVALTLTVLDAAGKAISNSPAVKLEIISGPGEFPTGPSILFEEKSDIRILDGQAAIEFRSYYAGRTLIRATSPGLEASEITLGFTGDAPYTAGKTPATRPRPYTRFNAAAGTGALQVFGRNNPTFASSAATGHTAGQATDGNQTTWWQPDSGDKQPSWTLDTERGLDITEIRLQFPEAAAHHYRVEVSPDNTHWTAVFTHTGDNAPEAGRRIAVPASGRFVRVSFTSPAPRIAEVEVTGKVQN